MADEADAPLPEEASWPPGQSFPEAEAVRAQCSACGLAWRIHRDLAGYRLRCRCGAWVSVTRPTRELLAAPVEAAPVAAALVASTEETPVAVVIAAPLEVAFSSPAPIAGLRRRAPTATGAVVAELVLLALAFWTPALAIQFFAPPHEQALLLPLASAATSLLVLLVGLRTRGDMFAGLTWPRVAHWIEAAGATVVALGVVFLYQEFLESIVPDFDPDELLRVRQDAGTAMALFAIAVVPGIFEELAFRGLIQGRLARLLDPQQAMVITASTFALAHGATLALPIHAGLGFYLCWLRSRSRSLLPGMLFHCAYNGALVIIG